jgi:hypothetical protein
MQSLEVVCVCVCVVCCVLHVLTAIHIYFIHILDYEWLWYEITIVEEIG